MVPPDASLSRLLTLVEQWQRDSTPHQDNVPAQQLLHMDVSALKFAAQQHAEALRAYADCHRGADVTLDAADWLDPKEEA